MRMVQFPHVYVRTNARERTLFLAGGIDDCPDWQAEIARLLHDTSLTLVNPRPENPLVRPPSGNLRYFPGARPADPRKQAYWDDIHLTASAAILFWFPRESLCPLALYHLGHVTITAKPLYVGAHPEYALRVEIELLTHLARPEVAVVSSLSQLTDRVRAVEGGMKP